MTRTAWRPRHVTAVEPEINVTPLVDVVLVLLIIFMVVAPRMEQDIPVNLPGIFNPDPDAEVSSPPVMVTVKDAGTFFIDGQQYDLDSAVAQLSAEHSADPYRRLELRADTKLKYKDVRDLYARVQQVGFPGMSLLVSHRYQGGENAAAAPEAAPAAPGGENAAPADAAPPAPEPAVAPQGG